MSKYDDRTLYCDDGTPIPWLEKSVHNHLDITTLIFGGSGSGKSFLIDEIIWLCRKEIPNYLVIAPKTSKVPYRERIPPRCYKEDLSKAKLIQIWKRQVNLTQCYNIANDPVVLSGLFMKAPDKNAVLMIRAITQRAHEILDTIANNSTLNFSQKKAQKNVIHELEQKKLREVYKQTIRKNRSILQQMNLTEHEKVALKFLDTNPRLMLIIDDCTEQFVRWMKYFKKGEDNIFEKIFYKGRHNFITLIFAAHDDKAVDPQLRKNSRVTIFANSQALSACMMKQSSGYTKIEQKTAAKMGEKLFAGEDGEVKTFQKLCYIREDSQPFKYTIADQYDDYSVGCEPLAQLIKKMPEKSDNIANNPFVKSIIEPEKKSRKPKPKRD